MKSFAILFCALLVFQSCKDKKETTFGLESGTFITEQTTIQVVSPNSFQEQLLEAKKPQLVDVRTPEEFEDVHLVGAVNISVTNDTFLVNAATLDKETPVYLYCRSGGRSARAAQQFKELGFTKIYDLEGGITAWQAAGLPTE
ncbi:rhodanese-like domain-containing protein [Altibacter sp.]|uniref:rhodanese-like domain-containing protein n=1 Tax=Altibacter sp. TaxID=2024823 RepID=UPI000C997A8F|nr:rhodanese-like domain-containing protein [Altibacter sp.]MAP53565.1 hypothetical protein [Altibacter sp.]